MVRYLEDEYWYFQENPSIVTGTSEDVSILALSDQLKVETPTSLEEPMPRRSVPSSGDLDASTLLAESPTAKKTDLEENAPTTLEFPTLVDVLVTSKKHGNFTDRGLEGPLGES